MSVLANLAAVARKRSVQQDPIPATFIILPSGGTNGDMVTDSYMATATHGDNGPWTSLVDNVENPLDHTFVSVDSANLRGVVSVGGTDYQNLSRSVRINRDIASTYNEVHLAFAGSYPKLSYHCLFKFDAVSPSTTSNIDAIDIELGAFNVSQLRVQDSDETCSFTAHAYSGALGTVFVERDTWIEVNGFLDPDDGAAGLLKLIYVDHATGVLLGYIYIDSPLTGDAVVLKFHDYLAQVDCVGSFYWGAFVCDTVNFVFPFFAFTIETPVVTATQTGFEEVTVSWSAPAVNVNYRIERQHSGIWTEIESSQTALSFVDDAATTGETYTYRVTASLLGTNSTAGISDSVTILAAPTLSTATIGTAGTSLTLVFNSTMTAGAGGTGGMDLTASGGAVSATYSSGTGSSTLIYSLNRTILSTETATLDYIQPGTGLKSGPVNLASFTAAAVTNNSTQTGSGAWHDVLELVDATSTGDLTIPEAHKITLASGGTLSKWRIGIMYGFGVGNCKVALYDSSLNLVAGTNATIPVPATDNNVIEYSIAPVSLSAGDYWLALVADTGNIYFGKLGAQSATDGIYFGVDYAAFPTANITGANFGNTIREAIGIFT